MLLNRLKVLTSFCIALFLIGISLIVIPSRFVDARETSTWPDIELVKRFEGFTQPVHITHAGDGTGRIFVVERSGIIKIIEDDVVLGTPFLDIEDKVQTDGGEEGLLSVAFPPNYASDQHFYVYYTNNSSNLIIARYGLSSANDADESSEQIILDIGHPTYRNHNGGQLAFGPNDGYLYIATGDGGGGGDPDENGQDLSTLLGKILRIDVETGDPATYFNPASNPFTSNAAQRDEIWAYGLRNPWRFSFDRQTGDLYLGDVGQGSYEEIDYQSASSSGGENYGWNTMEGAHCYNSSSCDQTGLTLPVAEYVNGSDCSVTGGYVYRGSSYPRMQGIYFYGDYCSGKIWGLQQNGSSWDNTLLLDTSHFISTFGEDEAGNLYLTSYTTGEIYQITDPTPDLSLSTKQVTPPYGKTGDTFIYTISLINAGDPLTQTTFLTDTLPVGLSYVTNTLTATLGTATYNSSVIEWTGDMNPTSTVQITYHVTATGVVTGALQNVAIIENPIVTSVTLSNTIIIDGKQIYLPVVLK